MNLGLHLFWPRMSPSQTGRQLYFIWLSVSAWSLLVDAAQCGIRVGKILSLRAGVSPHIWRTV